MTLAAAACAPAEPPVAEPPALTAPNPETELAKLLAAGPEVTVAGQRLNIDRLRSFYARHGFAPVWTTRQVDATVLMEAVFRAGDHGLDPELFHAAALRASDALPPLQRDLLLSDAFLAYTAALARGAVPVERRRNDETLTPGPIDVVAEFDAALASRDPARAIEALAPATPTYRLLRQALRELPTDKPGGRGVSKPAAGGADTARRQAILVNLERERWLPRRLPADRIWVNVPDQRLTMYRDDRSAFSTKVIIGQSERRNQTPELQVPIDAIWFNPPWTIPTDIAERAYLPKIQADPNYLARNNLIRLPDGALQQRVGPYSGLGSLLFDMNNRFDVYLHDTPAKELFKRDDRRISHGCVRVEDPKKLAALVMELSGEEIDRRIATRVTVRTPVPKPVPVFLVYQTAFADSDGKLQFRPDIYERDAKIRDALAPRRQAVAERFGLF
ncbi:MAG TPA: L,D-transpeptidase family protein [Hyphomicrobium sp.]|nr:L,D-transpeptidase family protein [Hyphomicrobium sp.]